MRNTKRYVVCVNNGGYEYALTVGKTYEVEGLSMLQGIGDKGVVFTACANRFKAVEHVESYGRHTAENRREGDDYDLTVGNIYSVRDYSNDRMYEVYNDRLEWVIKYKEKFELVTYPDTQPSDLALEAVHEAAQAGKVEKYTKPDAYTLRAQVEGITRQEAKRKTIAEAYGGDLTVGTKADIGKPPLSLIPRSATEAEARVLAFGAAKYAPHNWRKGMDWSRVIDAAMRHLQALSDGEDRDPETGELHAAHARCCTAFLIEYMTYKIGKDDRYVR